jgi:predicted O-methyltransferase YrrM
MNDLLQHNREIAMNTAMLDKILAERPKFHSGETETGSVIAAGDTILRGHDLETITKNLPTCWGIGPATARFIYDSVSEQTKTLETGAGTSTLIFALKMSTHIAITPNANEVKAIREYATKNQISLSRVEFVIEPSDSYLPRCARHDLDLVLIDGKHAFPWPIIDWYYTADMLREGGILILDDAEIAPVAILKDFMNEDPHWELLRCFGIHAAAFRKRSKSIRDVSWHMQPFITKRCGRKARLLDALRTLSGSVLDILKGRGSD